MNSLDAQVRKMSAPPLYLQSGSYPIFMAISITSLGILSLWPFSGGEDVANARQNILNGERTDFWGGFSQFFYSASGLSAPLWHIALGLVHALLVLTGTIVALNRSRDLQWSKVKLTVLLFVHYLATIFVLNISRDASLLAFLWMGIALLYRVTFSPNKSYLMLSLAITLIIIGLSFRPWLAAAFAPLVLMLIYSSKTLAHGVKKYMLLIFVLVFITTGPLTLDTISKRLMNLEASYPEQQVLILDVASIACLSPDKSSQSAALDALLVISNSSSLTRERLCGQFYPQNWGSLVFYSNPNDPALRVVGMNEENTYRTLRESWFNLLSTYPFDYLQIKVLQFSQFFFAGDSIRLSPNSFRDIYLIPYEMIKVLRLLSFAPMLIIFSWLTFSSRFHSQLMLRRSLLVCYVLTTTTITVAFIGDNQRYISWLALILLFSYLHAYDKVEKREPS